MPTGSESVRSARRALQVLRLVAERGPLQASRVAEELGFSLPTAWRLLQVLEAEQFVTRRAGRREYQLGAAVFALAQAFIDERRAIGRLWPYLWKLRDLSGETVSLHVLTGLARVCVAQAESHHELRRVVEQGRRLALNVGSGGRTLLAFRPVEEIRAFLNDRDAWARPTERTITDPGRLLESLRRIRRLGYGISHGEREHWISGVSAPVVDGSGFAQACFVISGPTERWNAGKIEAFVPELLRHAGKASQELGWFGPYPPHFSEEGLDNGLAGL